MADLIREEILEGLATRLRSITVANGYRDTVRTVQLGFRDPNNVPESVRPLIAIMPVRESWFDQSGSEVRVDWVIDLYCYATPAEASTDSMARRLSDFTADVRKALYADPACLNVSGLVKISITGRQGTEGVEEGLRKTPLAAMILNLSARFYEVTSA